MRDSDEINSLKKKKKRQERGSTTVIIPVQKRTATHTNIAVNSSLVIFSQGMGVLAWKPSALPRRKKSGALPGPPPSLGVRCHAEKGCPPCQSQGHGELSAEGHLASLLNGSPSWGPVPRAGAGQPEAVAAVTPFLIPPLASASVPRGAAGVDARGLGSRGH